MPALITHDTFGHDVYAELYESIGGSRDEAEAFLLGNQGPDPLFYSLLNPKLRFAHNLSRLMHRRYPSELLYEFKKSVSVLPESEASIGRAYVLGFLCHYAMDSTLHPLVYNQVYALTDAGEPGLTRKNASEVHLYIETELDELVLTVKRNERISTFNPSREILKASNHVLEIISKMYAYVAMHLYGMTIPLNTYSSSVKLFRRSQEFFYSPRGLKHNVLGRIETLVRPYSYYRSFSHRNIPITESAFDNHEHAVWKNPYTNEETNDSFWDLYDKALKKAADGIAIIDEIDFDVERARSITDDVDFNGEPVVASILTVETLPPNSSSGAGE